MSFAVADKDPRKVAAGRTGALARWGDQRRIVRIDMLTPEERAVVLALVEAKKSAPAAPAETLQEVDRASDPTPTS